MNLRESMKHLYKTFRNDHSENFKENQATLLQLKNETASRTDKIIMKESITILIELKQKFQQNIHRKTVSPDYSCQKRRSNPFVLRMQDSTAYP